MTALPMALGHRWSASTAASALRGRVVIMRQPAAADELIVAMARIAAGDQSAFARLYDTTSRKVFGIVLSVLKDRAQAEEVTQEVYVVAWRSAPTFDPDKGSPTAWLHTIAHRKAVDRVRSAAKSIARDQRHADSEVARFATDTADLVVEADESRRVRDALAQLTEAQRTALELAFYDGRSYREVAEYLEVPLGTVKTRIRDAMKRLRTSLGEVPST